MQSLTLKKLHVALFAGATAALLAMPTHAAVVNTVLTTPIAITNSIDGVYLNIVTGVSGSSGATVTGWDINPYNNGAGLTFYGAATPSGILATGTAGTSAVAQLLTVGSVVSPTPAVGFYNQFQTLGTLFQGLSGTQYVGLRFLNEATSATNYGYLTLTVTPGTGFPASITGWSYENTGLAITVAAVPEASTYAMMGLGLAAIGALGLKRRRAA